VGTSGATSTAVKKEPMKKKRRRHYKKKEEWRKEGKGKFRKKDQYTSRNATKKGRYLDTDSTPNEPLNHLRHKAAHKKWGKKQ